MSKMKFSNGKFSKFISSKSFYVALAVCLVGAGAATWLAVDRTISGIEKQNDRIIANEGKFHDFPLLEEAETKQEEIPKPAPSSSSSTSSSSSAASSTSPAASSAPDAPSEIPTAAVKSPVLSYVWPIKGEVITPFSAGELVKNITMGDWRTHDGIDIYAEKGADILAVADGVVTAVKHDPLWGTMVTISHADGAESLYCGLEKNVAVRSGENVMIKQVLGKLDGVPCEITERSHLHFAMRKSHAWMDPVGVLGKNSK